MYFSKDAKETVISCMDIVLGTKRTFDKLWQMSKCRKGNRTLHFLSTNRLHAAEVWLCMQNKLWYVDQSVERTCYCLQVATLDESIIQKLTGTAVHDLWNH